jgi:hypothetical protein
MQAEGQILSHLLAGPAIVLEPARLVPDFGRDAPGRVCRFEQLNTGIKGIGSTVASGISGTPQPDWSHVMPGYRIYTLTEGGKISGPPVEVSCDDDEDVIQQAKQLLNGADLEVWHGGRVVTRLKHTGAGWKRGAPIVR